MANPISQNQNTKENLRHFAASRTWYAKGKRISSLQLLIAVSLPLLSAWILASRPGTKSKAWVAFLGISASLAEALILDPLQRRYRGNGANEQEVFDCGVLGLPWPAGFAGSPPETESTAEAARRWEKNDPSFEREDGNGPQRNRIAPATL